MVYESCISGALLVLKTLIKKLINCDTISAQICLIRLQRPIHDNSPVFCKTKCACLDIMRIISFICTSLFPLLLTVCVIRIFRFTVADCILGYNMWWASQIKGGILLEHFPELVSYFNRLRNRPAFQQTWNNS